MDHLIECDVMEGEFVRVTLVIYNVDQACETKHIIHIPKDMLNRCNHLPISSRSRIIAVSFFEANNEYKMSVFVFYQVKIVHRTSTVSCFKMEYK